MSLFSNDNLYVGQLITELILKYFLFITWQRWVDFFLFFFFFFAQELKGLLEELSFQKGELNVQISEKKNQLSLLKQEIEKEEENLQVVLGQMSKHKTGKFKV